MFEHILNTTHGFSSKHIYIHLIGMEIVKRRIKHNLGFILQYTYNEYYSLLMTLDNVIH